MTDGRTAHCPQCGLAVVTIHDTAWSEPLAVRLVIAHVAGEHGTKAALSLGAKPRGAILGLPAAPRKHQRRVRSASPIALPSPTRHGSSNGYRLGCGCHPCAEAQHAAYLRWKARRDAGLTKEYRRTVTG